MRMIRYMGVLVVLGASLSLAASQARGECFHAQSPTSVSLLPGGRGQSSPLETVARLVAQFEPETVPEKPTHPDPEPPCLRCSHSPAAPPLTSVARSGETQDLWLSLPGEGPSGGFALAALGPASLYQSQCSEVPKPPPRSLCD